MCRCALSLKNYHFGRKDNFHFRWSWSVFVIETMFYKQLSKDAYLIQYEKHGSHITDSFLICKCSCKMLHTFSFERLTVPPISHTFILWSFSIISWILSITSRVFTWHQGCLVYNILMWLVWKFGKHLYIVLVKSATIMVSP